MGTTHRRGVDRAPESPPGQPIPPEFDPAVRSLRQRELAKFEELRATGHDLALITLQRQRSRYEAKGLLGLVDGRYLARRPVLGRDDERVVAVVRRLIDNETELSTGTVSRLQRKLEKALLAEYGRDDAPKVPSQATFYRLVKRLEEGKHTFGSARTRRSLAKQPDGPFGTVTAARPGEVVEIDSTPLDVRVVLDDGVVGRRRVRRRRDTAAVDGGAAARGGRDVGGGERMGAEVNNPAIRVRDLRYFYPGGHPALGGVDLDIAPGERVALLGPNGAGKTTLMLHLNGVLSALQGADEIGGTTLSRNTLRKIRRKVGVVFQDPDDQLFMPTLPQDVAFGPANFGFRGAELEARVARALQVVSMTDLAARSPAHMSGGQRRRAALATVLACEPEVLVLDEPSANLDPVARRELAETLSGLGATIVIVTHDLPYAAQLCDRAIVMDDGVIVADGAIDAVLSDAEMLAAHRLELPLGFVVGAR